LITSATLFTGNLGLDPRSLKRPFNSPRKGIGQVFEIFGKPFQLLENSFSNWFIKGSEFIGSFRKKSNLITSH